MYFSIVIPAYNASHLILDTLDTVREQTFQDFEVLVTNDGSTDDTAEKLAEYARNWPKFPLKVVSQTNTGIGGARNNGLFRASGEYIAFLDADDHWYPAKLQLVKNIIDKNPEIDIVCHDEIEIRSDGKKVRSYYGEVKSPAYEDLLFNGNKLSTSATVVKRKLAIASGGFSVNPDFNSAEDYDFWLRLARLGGRFFYLPEIMGEYRRVDGSITARIEYHNRNAFNVIEHHIRCMEQEKRHPNIFLEDTMKRKKAENFTGIATSFLKCGDSIIARKFYIDALAIKPVYLKALVGLILTFVDSNGRIINRLT